MKRKFAKQTSTMIEANKIIISAFVEEFGSTFKQSHTSMPKLVKWASWAVFVFTLLIMKPLYHTSDLSALCITLASFSFAWMLVLVAKQEVIVSQQFTHKVTNALYRVIERIQLKFPDQFRESDDVDLESLRPSVEGFTHEALRHFLDLLLPLSYWDSLGCFSLSILGVITNNLPSGWAIWHYSFATVCLAWSVMLTFRVCLIIGASVMYRAMSAGVELDAYQVEDVAATNEDVPQD
ncbi:hypothetical protein D2Q93_04500 [Alicyclobacillaceae bacterium I2511]|jgi:hypothetical protein|nr:hypothetical protein D2Q93_04500 [Alicyclobacillaceae bacterium I2511]